MIFKSLFTSAFVAALFVTASVAFASTEDIQQKASQTADEFKLTMNQKLTKLKTQIDKLESDAKESSGKAKVAVSERLKSLEARRESLKKQINETSDKSGHAWVHMKDGLARAMKDLEVGYRNAKAEIQAKTGHKQE